MNFSKTGTEKFTFWLTGTSYYTYMYIYLEREGERERDKQKF